MEVNPFYPQMPGYHKESSRIDAEELLRDKPVGSYVLREEDEIINLKGHLYAITAIDPEHKLVERLIVKTEKGFMLYNDDPNLAHYQAYGSLHLLLEHEMPFAKHPISEHPAR